MVLTRLRRSIGVDAEEIDGAPPLTLSNEAGKRWIMSDGGTVGDKQKSRRQQRLEAQLRENLRRRKEQARARRDESAERDPADAAETGPSSAPQDGPNS